MSEYERDQIRVIGKIGKHEIRETNIGILHDLESLKDAKIVGGGDIVSIARGEVGVTFGANPCFAGVIVTRRGKLYLFHSLGDTLPDEVVSLIDPKKLSGGLIGGGSRSIDYYRGLLEEAGLEIKKPPQPWADFNVGVVRRKETSAFGQPIPPGIYCTWELPD